MKTRVASCLFALALAGAFPALAPGADAPAAPAVPAANPAIDPDALAALRSMGAFLRTLNSFQVTAVTTTEDVYDDDQKILSTVTSDMLIQKPDQMRVRMTGDGAEHRLYFNGKTFTIWTPDENFYATVPAPATIGELIEHLDAKYGMELPLVDLFHWGSDHYSDAQITGGMTVGICLIDGASCTQYAFRQAGLDWQIWIQNGASPLPRKLVLTTLTDPAKPQFTATYTWNLAPAYNAAAFTFVPPTGAAKITLAEIKATSPSK